VNGGGQADGQFPTVQQSIQRIQEIDPKIRAFVSTRLEAAAREAKQLPDLPEPNLRGVPFSLKDLWESLDLPTTGGSLRHRNRPSPQDAPILTALRAAGAVFMGKTNLSDLSVPPEATNWLVGATHHPQNEECTPGGSSGGAAAAVASGMVGFDWGADIGGSIRYPAGLCGVYGLRLSTETWPVTAGMFPAVPPAMSFMCAQGPLAKSPRAMRRVLEAVKGTLRENPGWRQFRAEEIILWAPDPGTEWDGFAKDVEPVLRTALGLPVSGSHLVLPNLRRVFDIYVGVWASHFDEFVSCDPSLTFWSGMAATVLAVLFRGLVDKRIHPSTAEVLLFLAVKRALVFRDKSRALAEAQTVKAALESLWRNNVVVAMPVSCWPAPRIGTTNRHLPDLIRCSVPGNLADATALAIPFDSFPNGMPRALQLVGPPGSEFHLLDLAEKLRTR